MRRRGPRMPLRRVVAGVLGLSVSAVALFFLAGSVDLGATGEALGRARPGWILAALFVVPVLVALRTWRWQTLLPMGADGVRPRVARVVAPLLAGNLANLVLPARVGEPVRAYLLAHRERLGFSGVLGSIALERVIDIGTLAAVALPAAVAARAGGWMVSGLAALAAIGLSGIAVLASPFLRRTVAAIARRRRVSDHAVASRVAAVILSFIVGARGSGSIGVLTAVAVSTVTWLFVAFVVWLLAGSLGIGVDPVRAMVVAGIASLGSAIPSAPAAIGTYELASVVAGRAIGLADPEALALGLLTHVVTTVPFVLAGGVAVSTMSVQLTGVAADAAAASDDARLLPERG